MARLELNERIYEIPESTIRRILESQAPGNARSGYPVPIHDEYHIAPSGTGISDTEIQSALGNPDFMDLNGRRNSIKETTWQC